MKNEETELINYLIKEIFPITPNQHDSRWFMEQYDKLIQHYKLHGPKPEEYTEIHHIIPKCQGGTDIPDNLVELPIRSHILAHLLLYLGNQDSISLSLAVLIMLPTNCSDKINGNSCTQERRLTIISENFNLEEIVLLKEQARKSLIGRPGVKHSDDFKKLMSEKMSGENNPMFGKHGKDHPSFGKSVSDKTKNKISESLKGRNLSETVKNKISDTLKGRGKGRKLSDATKIKISKNHYDCSLGNNSQSKQVKNLNTGQIYLSAKEAFLSSNLNMTYGRFIQLLNNGGYKRNSKERFIWSWNI